MAGAVGWPAPAPPPGRTCDNALRASGHSPEQAEGVVDVVQEATRDLVTRDMLQADLATAMAQMEARFTRLLWLQLAAYTAATAALMAIALAVAAALWG